MTRLHITLATSALSLVALCAVARADAFDCKPTETQAECHKRLRCKADEEIEVCQRRLRNAQQQQNNGDGDDRGGDRGNDDRGNDRGGNDDRGSSRRGGDDDRGSSRRGGGGSDNSSRRRRSGGSGSHRFEANKTFGLGLELGEPTGLNGKFFFGPRIALDFGLGWIYEHYYYGDGLHLYADILFHPISFTSNPTFELPFYIGGGLRFWDFDYCYRATRNAPCAYYGGSAIGLRVPVGIAFDFNKAPIDIFIQAVPTLDFIRGDFYDRGYYDRRNHFGIDFSVGVRFWFK